MNRSNPLPQKYLWPHLEHHPNPNSRHYDKEVQIANKKLALYVWYMTLSILWQFWVRKIDKKEKLKRKWGLCRERFILDLGVVKCDHGEELSIALYRPWQHHHTILLKPSIFLYIKDNMLFMKVLFLIIFITNITGCEGRGFQLGVVAMRCCERQ